MSSDLDGKSLGRQVNSFPAKQGRALRLVQSKLWGVWKFECIPDCQYIGRVVAAISIQWWEPRMLSIHRGRHRPAPAAKNALVGTCWTSVHRSLGSTLSDSQGIELTLHHRLRVNDSPGHLGWNLFLNTTALFHRLGSHTAR